MIFNRVPGEVRLEINYTYNIIMEIILREFALDQANLRPDALMLMLMPGVNLCCMLSRTNKLPCNNDNYTTHLVLSKPLAATLSRIHFSSPSHSMTGFFYILTVLFSWTVKVYIACPLKNKSSQRFIPGKRLLEAWKFSIWKRNEI